MFGCIELPLTGHDCVGCELFDKFDECVSVIRCASICLVKVADLVRSLRVQNPQKKRRWLIKKGSKPAAVHRPSALADS
ncbi:MAG: hypothetical protein IKD09_05890 [Lentisphaeria bacterium]|nr:hypothetical protein [Lentisphaeria bacterium]